MLVRYRYIKDEYESNGFNVNLISDNGAPFPYWTATKVLDIHRIDGWGLGVENERNEAVGGVGSG